MADDNNPPAPIRQENGETGPPSAVVLAKGGFSLVWLVPIVAALIGAFLAYRAISERGPSITITFESGEGLEAGKTKIKYRDIEVGQVTAVTLAPDISHVIVRAQIGKGGERYLTEKTRFWVVRARVSAGQVSGLDTVFSGAYIAVEPSLEGKPRREFTGLEVAPIVTRGERGRHFKLVSDTLGSLDVGAPVYYRSIRVGRTVAYELDESGDFVTIEVFVRAPNDERIRENTRWWNSSGIDVTLDADGVHVDTASLVSVMIGGVSFDSPETLEPGGEVEADHVFHLYPNRRATLQRTYTLKQSYLMYFSGSVAGLEPGAAVVFQGIKIGEVIDVKLQFDRDAVEFRVPVLIQIEPERVEALGSDAMKPQERMRELVNRGLRGQLATSNLLTGKLEVELALHSDAPPAELTQEGRYFVIPTLPTTVEAITQSLGRIMRRIDEMPLDQIGENLKTSLENLNATLAQSEGFATQLNEELAPALATTLAELDRTLTSTRTLLASDSPTRVELERALAELAEAARSARTLADYLEQHPESLLRGKKQ